MSGLVGYASSDDDEEVQPSKPAKIAKTEASSDTSGAAAAKSTDEVPGKSKTQRADQGKAQPTAPPTTTQQPRPQDTAPPPAAAPAAGPALAPTESAPPADLSPPQSPYTTERNLLRNLTMPTHPNFSIPASPSPPPTNSEAAATLSTTTKKLKRFLELKAQGVHFNARLENNTALRNPGVGEKMREFAGVREEESYASTLGVKAGGVPAGWPREWYVEALVKENERRVKKAGKERDGVEFVRGKGEGGAGGSEHRKSKFDR